VDSDDEMDADSSASEAEASSSTARRGGLAEEAQGGIDVDAEAHHRGLQSPAAESLSNIVEIREYIDDAGSTTKSEVVDLGKILKASPAAALKLYGKDDAAAAEAQHADTAVLQKQHEQQQQAQQQQQSSAADDAAYYSALAELERQEAAAAEEDSEYKVKGGIVGTGWGKGFLSGGSKKQKSKKPAAKAAAAKPAVVAGAQQQEAAVALPPPPPLAVQQQLTAAVVSSTAPTTAAAVLQRSTAAASNAPQRQQPVADSSTTSRNAPASAATTAAAAAGDSANIEQAASAAGGGSRRRSVRFNPEVQEREIPARELTDYQESAEELMRMFTGSISESDTAVRAQQRSNGPTPPDVQSLRELRDRLYTPPPSDGAVQAAEVSALQQQQAASAQPRMSKFKMRRLGLDPDNTH
jgi:hypothetical protein